MIENNNNLKEMNQIDLTDFEEIKFHPNYLINKQGQIYNKKYKKIMTEQEQRGYKWVKLNYIKCYIHRLVALQYIETDNIELQIDHIDRNRANNNVDNLRWVTHYENSLNKEEGKGCIYQDREYWKGRFSWNENGKNEIRQITREDKSEVDDWLEKIKLDHNYEAPIKSRKTIITEEDKELQNQRKKEYKDKYYADEANREKKRIKDKEYREKNKEKNNAKRREIYANGKKLSLSNI
jgi:hypothetical protein